MYRFLACRHRYRSRFLFSDFARSAGGKSTHKCSSTPQYPGRQRAARRLLLLLRLPLKTYRIVARIQQQGVTKIDRVAALSICINPTRTISQTEQISFAGLNKAPPTPHTRRARIVSKNLSLERFCLFDSDSQQITTCTITRWQFR